ncbi:uncharacterized protein LOC128268977 [Anopheles cruzii]|uniref:uncharacterized protein LOC128268977 n=1 Tax=Anopheles cruzii TaxID=68878 RepID=UPI0022EC2F08|nr:uncharacterized protein LOC128268977 [Anopheles cruzii]
MFSFFKSKKPSPEQTPSEPIPGPIPVVLKDEDFIFVERRGSPKGGPGAEQPSGGPGASLPASSNSSALYPAVPERPKSPVNVRQHNEEKIGHVLHDVPMRLAAELCPYTNPEDTRIQLNEVLAFIWRSTSGYETMVDYDFSLERSVLQD